MSSNTLMARARRFMPSLAALAVAAGTVLAADGQAVAAVDPALFKALHWRGIGPFAAAARLR